MVLHRRLMLERFEGARDASGGLVGAWRAVCRLWAEMEPSSLATPAQFRAFLRWRAASDIARPRAGMRLREGERVFRILEVVEPDSQRRFLVCRVEEESPR